MIFWKASNCAAYDAIQAAYIGLRIMAFLLGHHFLTGLEITETVLTIILPQHFFFILQASCLIFPGHYFTMIKFNFMMIKFKRDVGKSSFHYDFKDYKLSIIN